MKKALTSFLVLLSSSILSARSSYDPFNHYDRSMDVLLAWGGASAVTGGALLFSDNQTVKWSGMQHLLWGAIDAGIALGAKYRNQRDRQRLTPEQKITGFRRLMVINGLLDVAYIGTGVLMMTLSDNERIRGSGQGITIQGGFLLGFDWINYGLTFRK